MVKLNVSAGRGLGRTTTTQEDWVRNPEWLTMPSPGANDGKIYLLVRIDQNTENYVRLYLNGSVSNTFTVDWGDGSTVQTYNYNTLPEYVYDYNNANLASSLTTEGYKQAIITITVNINDYFGFFQLIPNASSSRMVYYKGRFMEVILAAPNLQRFWTNSSTVWDLEYLESVTFVSATFDTFHYFLYGAYNLRNVTIGSNVGFLNNTNQNFNCSYMFMYCRKLSDATIHALVDRLVNTPSTVYRMFYGCEELITGPAINTSNTTDWYQTFGYCYKLRSIPLYNTSNVTRFYYAFANCYSLKRIPLLNTSSGTDFRAMFANCHSLTSVPHFDISNGTLLDSMFSACTNLDNIPHFNTSNATSMNSTFNSCITLKTVPDFDYSSVIGAGFSQTFYGCYNLEKDEIVINTNITGSNSGLYRTFNGAKVKKVTIQGDFIPTYIYGCRETFNGCVTLEEFNVTGTCDTSNVPWLYRMFTSCFSLKISPTLDFSSSTRNDNVFSNNFSREDISVTNVAENFWVDNCNLDATKLNTLFTNALGTVTGKTIYINNNPGAATCNRTIATNKGWTVVG